MKRILGLFGLLAVVGGALMFWRRRKDDDAFLDEELE
jgi:LPXTG-motif cell wall-anchored protein